MFKTKVSLEEQKAQKEDRFLRGREIAYLIFDYFQVTDVNESVLDYTDLFTVVLRNDKVQEFDARWDKLFIVNGASLYKLRIRGSEKLKIVFELYNLEIHQKKAKPDYHRLKTMVKKRATFQVTKLRG